MTDVFLNLIDIAAHYDRRLNLLDMAAHYDRRLI